MTSDALSAVMDSGFSACPSGSSQNPRIYWIANLDFAASDGSVCVMLRLSTKCVYLAPAASAGPSRSAGAIFSA